MDKIVIFATAGIIVAASALYNFFKKNFFTFKFKNKDIIIIFKYLELKYNIKNDLKNLSTVLINNNKDFLKKIIEKINALKEDENLKKILSEKKKIILLGHTGVGKSTLINCIEGQIIAQEAQINAPTTMEFIGYNSDKYKNFVFYDTRGIENNNISQIEEDNKKKILEILKGQNSYLFWYVKGTIGSFEETEAKYIKKIKKLLNENATFFFVITKSADDENDEKKLKEALKQYFPDKINITIVPVYARGTNKIKSYGVDDLMNKSENFFKSLIIDKFFEKISIKDIFDEILSIEELLKLNLKQIRLQDIELNLDNNENGLIKNFVENEYENFVNKNIDEINELCCLIKAKNKVIENDSEKEINKRLITINNSNEVIENNIREEILQGCSKSQKEEIDLKYNKYLKKDDIKEKVKNILKNFVVKIFNIELINNIKDNLLNENILNIY